MLVLILGKCFHICGSDNVAAPSSWPWVIKETFVLLVMVTGTGTVEEGSQIDFQARVGQCSYHLILSCSAYLASQFPWQQFQKIKKQQEHKPG